MPIALLDLTLPSLAENLALDEVLLLEAEDGRAGEVLRFWEWRTPAVVLGAGGKIEEDVELRNCMLDEVPIQRRSSGGGTVLLGSGCLLFSLILRTDRDPTLCEVRSSYRWILERIRGALSPLLASEQLGISDLATTELKFSGNAQQRKRDHLLHHGTLLYNFSIEQVSRYLKLPEKRPEYRAGRSHIAFLTNLSASPEELKKRIAKAWDVNESPVAIPKPRIMELVNQKYNLGEWVHRR